MTITQEKLKRLLRYDPSTGVFTWLERPNNRIHIGDVAGQLNKDGYRLIRIEGQFYMAHRLAWFYLRGVWPSDEIDHRNGSRDDNRFDNLREATHGQNQQNRLANKNNSSGHLGVFFDKRRHRWFAQIRVNCRQVYLGSHDDKDKARDAYRVAKSKLHTFNPTARA